jgi:hypothetical protein
MNLTKIKAQTRLLAVLAALLPTACAFFEPATPANPLVGTWTTQDHNKVTFLADAVVVTPEKGPVATLGPADCNGRYKLVTGRMNTASLQKSFPTQPDLQSRLRQFLVQPDYPVVDVTCDQGGTTYLMLDNNRMLAVYRDGGIGGLEAYSRI